MSPDSVGGKTVAEQLQRSLRILAIATVFLYVGLIIVGVRVYLDSRNTADALCTFRQDLERRVIATTDFLKENPKGIPGIPPRFLLESVANQQRTIVSLQSLDCKSLNKSSAETTLPSSLQSQENP